VRQGFLTHDNEDFSWRLLAFAERMASLAVRESSPERLLDGLLALLIGYYRVDVRDVLTVLAIIYDAGIKIGAQPDNLLLDAATMINNSIAQIMLEFTSRTPTNKSLQNFFYKEDHDLDGFRYMRIP
jgi:hypothetical protein